MKKYITILFMLISTFSYSLIGDILKENVQNPNRWELYSVIDEWEEPTGIKIPCYEHIYIKDSKREIKIEDVPTTGYIVYKNMNNDLVMNIYKQAKVIEIDSRYDEIDKIKIRFDKNKIVVAECLTSIETGSFESESTGQVYYGDTMCTIKLTKEIISLMKKSKEMEIVIPYFNSTSLIKIKLDGFSSAINYYLKH
ncbi:hypothetical protein KST74_08650 [Fusobacterium nucleatum]|uniref:hypothetical protein n=1 Tax=Fusobacterium nucleatum TaxID=851 RepID=UPI0030CC8A6C